MFYYIVMHIHVSFQVLSKFKCINTNQESRIHSKTVFISPYTQSRGTTTKERGIPAFIYKKEKKETYKITILSIFTEFVFLCKRICDISEIQDDEGLCFHWWDHNHRNFKAEENMLLILFSEQTWRLQTGLQFIWHHLNVIKVQDPTMATEGINKVDLRWFDCSSIVYF